MNYAAYGNHFYSICKSMYTGKQKASKTIIWHLCIDFLGSAMIHCPDIKLSLHSEVVPLNLTPFLGRREAKVTFS